MVWSFVRISALIPVVLAIGAMSASAASILISFDDELGCTDANPLCAIGGNSFTSADSSEVVFSDTAFAFFPGNEMFLIDESFTSSAGTGNGKALAVGWDGDSSALQILFDLPATSIGMDLFVGDGFSIQDGDTAELTAYMGVQLVGQVSADLDDEKIFFDGATFNRVEIAYVGSVQGGMTEIVDNVSATVVPEPQAAVVFGVGALLVGAACARRGRT
jgi:hypothetical protein